MPRGVADCGANESLPKFVWLIWSPAFGFYEPPFTSRREATKFARIENADIESDERGRPIEAQRVRVIRCRVVL